MKKSKENIETTESSGKKTERLNPAGKSAAKRQTRKSASDNSDQKLPEEKLRRSSSPVCFAESDEIRDEYRTDK